MFTPREESSYQQEFIKKFLWLMSNLIFIAVFSVLLCLDAEDNANYTEVTLFQSMIMIWLLNSCINLSITWFLRDKTL